MKMKNQLVFNNKIEGSRRQILINVFRKENGNLSGGKGKRFLLKALIPTNSQNRKTNNARQEITWKIQDYTQT